MKTLIVNGKEKTVPTSWEEVAMDKNLLLFAVKLLLSNSNKFEIKLKFLYHLLGVKDKVQNEVYIQLLLSNDVSKKQSEMLSAGLDLIGFITDKKLKVETNYFPALFNYFRLHGTTNVLRDFKVWEFALAERFLFDYINSADVNDLNRFIAVWYRPAKRLMYTNGIDNRIAFKDNEIEMRAVRVARIEMTVKWLIMQFFASQRELITKQYPYTFKPAKGKNTEGGTWFDTIISLSTPGDEEKTANAPLAVILQRIENESKKYNEYINTKE